MALILSIETSTNVGSIAIHDGQDLLLYQENQIKQSHSEHMASIIKNMMDTAQLKASDLDAVAISKGPGSYTGLRIGVSLAKGICYANDTRLIAVNTLEAMARETSYFNVGSAFMCPMIDARRMEVYCQMFDADFQKATDVSAEIIDELSFRKYLDANKVLFFGNGAEKCKSVIIHENAFFIDDIVPKAKYIGEIAHKRFEMGEFENLAYFEPYYLKEFLAKKPSGKNLV